MKVSEGVDRTQLPRETIPYSIREGVLSGPRKMGKNVVEYNETLIQRVRLIKDL